MFKMIKTRLTSNYKLQYWLTALNLTALEYEMGRQLYCSIMTVLYGFTL